MNGPEDRRATVGPTVDQGVDRQVSRADAAPEIAARQFVGRIVETSKDCAWGASTTPGGLLLRVRSGERLELLQGLAEIEFSSGAKLIMHGPTVFVPTGPESGELVSGRLTGEVTNGNFRLLTPAAEVIDLGTEFGVAASAETGTDVVVFDGRVKVVGQPDAAGVRQEFDMTEGMGARVRADGAAEYGWKGDAAPFVRSISRRDALRETREVCLVDVVAGGDGFGERLAGAVDPASGERDYGEHGRTMPHQGRWSELAFHGVAWHPMIDGVFIPTQSGVGVPIDSAGHTVDLPQSVGWAYGSIWARRAESAVVANDQLDIDFWGERTLRGIVERLGECRRGMIGIHSNAGLTFDLRTMHMTHGAAPREFRAIVANLENSADWSPEEKPEYQHFRRTVDFRVFVDGQLRFSRLGFRREDGELPFTVPLAPGDRHLSVVVTDDGNLEFDHVMLIDAVVELASD